MLREPSRQGLRLGQTTETCRPIRRPEPHSQRGIRETVQEVIVPTLRSVRDEAAALHRVFRRRVAGSWSACPRLANDVRSAPAYSNSAEWLRLRPRIPPGQRPLPDRLPVRVVDPAHLVRLPEGGEEIVALRIKGKGSVFQDVPVPGRLSAALLEWKAVQEKIKAAGSWLPAESPSRRRDRVRQDSGAPFFEPGVQFAGCGPPVEPSG